MGAEKLVEAVAKAISGAPFPSAKSLAKARAALAAIEAEGGWQLVPKEPTEEMVCAAETADADAANANVTEGGPGRGLYAAEIYREMLLAAPTMHANDTAMHGKP